MALDQAYVGKVYPPSGTYLVGREKVREFATAIGDANPAYHSVDAARALGHTDVVAPPTFAFVIAMRATEALVTDPGLGLDYSRVVHGEQRFSYTRPLVAGDEVRATTTIESIRVAAGNDVLLTRVDLETVAGEPLVSCWNTIVARGTAGEGS